MASVSQSLGQILRGEERQPRPIRVLSSADAALRADLCLDATKIGHNMVVRRLQAAVGRTPRAGPDSPVKKERGQVQADKPSLVSGGLLRMISPVSDTFK
jgi:hypothetical protein